MVMKKIVSTLLALSLLVATAGCTTAPAASSAVPSSSQSSQPDAQQQPFKIGIIQLAEHPALDDARIGFVEGLAAAGYEDGKNIILDIQNAQGDPANCVTIADKMINSQSDLILAIATPAAQAVANKTQDIPILITAVTDPATAKLVGTNELPGGNVTGTSDRNPVKEQMELLKTLVPDVKEVAILFCSSEANSEFQADLAAKQLTSMGIASRNATVTNANEIQQVIQSLAGKVDAIYTPTDNMMATAMPTVSATAHELGIPVIVGEPEVVKTGGLATFGLSYKNLGKQTADMAVRILRDGANPAEMPIEYLQETELVINETAVAKLGITVPVELASKATMVK